MDNATAKVINLTNHKETSDLIWNILGNDRPAETDDGLRWDLLSHWAELHHMTCGCDLRRPEACHRPLTAELSTWVGDSRPAVAAV